VIHLTAIARRIGVELGLKDFARLGRDVHTLVNLMPSGKYLMEDFYYAGGLPAVLHEISQVLNRDALTANGKTMGENGLLPHPDALTVNGRTIWDNVREAPSYNDEVIRPLDKPLIDDESLDIDENSIMVLKGCGPKGYPGMAEVGNMPLPPKLLKKGITDMVRISDARMSGTAYGTVVLHISPEAAAGGALALVENGDTIELDVAKRRLELLVPDETLSQRRKRWVKPEAPLERGYWKLYFDHVLQAHQGADLDFLVGKSGAFVPRDNH